MLAGRAAIIAMTSQSTSNGSTGAISGPVNGVIHILIGILDDDIGQLRQNHLDMAAFILTTAWTVDIRQPHGYALNVCIPGAQCRPEAAFNMTAQGICQ